MTVVPPSPTQVVCRVCGTPFPRPVTVGRPVVFCSDDCRAAAANRPRAHATRPTILNGEQVAVVAEEMIRHLQALIDLARDEAPDSNTTVLESYQFLEHLHEALGAATVQQSRERDASWNEIGPALLMSPDTARKRWTPQQVDKLLAPYRIAGLHPAAPSKTRTAVPRTVPKARPRTGSARVTSRPTQGGTAHHGLDGHSPAPDRAQGPPGPAAAPDQQLTAALSELQRASGLTLKAIAHAAGVNPSYITRILAGERIPSWQVTRSIAAACYADPVPLRPLWEAARGRTPRPRANHAVLEAAALLHDVLCDLHLAAARPAPSAICEMAKGRIRTRDVAGLLDDGRIPDWHTVDQVVTVLHGHPDELRPLWQQARQLHTETCSLPAMAFG